MNLEGRLKRWLLLGTLLPVGLLILIGNLYLFHRLRRERGQYLQRYCMQNVEAVGQILFGSAIRVQSLTHMPSTIQLLAARERTAHSLSSRLGHGQTIEELWPELDEDKLAVREVLNNTVGEVFAQLCAADPFLDMLVLTDAEGRVLAASRKTLKYNYHNAAWWQLGRDHGNDVIVADPVMDDGILRLVVTIGQPGLTNRIRGILRADIKIQKIFNSIAIVPDENNITISFKNTGAIFPYGRDRDKIQPVLGALEEGRLASGSGWFGGMRFAAAPVRGDIHWPDKLWVIAAREEPRLDWKSFAPLVMSIFGGLFFLLVMAVVLNGLVKKRFVQPIEELLEAGDWALQNAMGRTSTLREDAGDQLSHEIQHSGTAIQQDLDVWLQRFRQALEDDVASRTSEIERDLSLAKDFQRAMLERPYPVIPDVHIEGRLRLGFYHRYDPASALGGDFFDIIKLGPDSGGVFIADVMGHGTRSALITSILRALIGDLIQQGRNAPHFMTGMNHQFCDLLKSIPNPLFASAFYFVADTTAHVATFSSAGHPAPFHIRRSVGRINRLEVPPPRGAALGVIPHEHYTGAHCRLVPEDVFIFFTDGLFETFNRKGVEFGIERVEKTLKRLMYKDVRTMVDELIAEVIDFADEEPIADDICLVAVEVTTRPIAAGG